MDLADQIGNKSGPTRLIQGQAARVDREGDHPADHAGRSQSTRQLVDRRLSCHWHQCHQEVRDNIPPSDGSQYFCYQINYHGLADDVFAYADDPHQWNGLTAAGLPEFLRGADYVKTFNDYRYMNDFQMTVILVAAR